MANVIALEGQNVIDVVCDAPGPFHRKHGPSVLAQLRHEERGDGSGGHYWDMLPAMTVRELERWQASDPLDMTMYPRGYRDPKQGFRWVKDGRLVTDPEESRAIAAAMHHGTGPGRKGAPAPGILDGVYRHFELRKCKCGERGVRRPAAPVEAVLERLNENLVARVGLVGFRRAIDTQASMAR